MFSYFFVIIQRHKLNVRTRKITPNIVNSRIFTRALHKDCTQYGTIIKLKSGNFRVQIRRRGQYASRTFLRRVDAQSWAMETECRADRGEQINLPVARKTLYFRDLIDLHIADMKEVRKPLRRSKVDCLKTLRKEIGKNDANRRILNIIQEDHLLLKPPPLLGALLKKCRGS